MIYRLLISSLFLFSLFLISPVLASAPKPIPQPVKTIAVESPKIRQVTTKLPSADILALVQKYANKYSVSESEMLSVIKCESGFSVSAVGDGGLSHGLAQFYLPARNQTKDGQVITEEMAHDPDIAIETMAYYFSLGMQNKWSCYKMIYR